MISVDCSNNLRRAAGRAFNGPHGREIAGWRSREAGLSGLRNAQLQRAGSSRATDS